MPDGHFLAHKIELYPTASQAVYLLRCIGARRFAYNALLEHFRQDGVKWSKKAAYGYFTRSVRQPWMGELTSRAPRNAIDDLDCAFKHFFRRVKLGQKPGFPTFHKRGVNDSFALREREKFTVEGRRLRLEKCPGNVKMRERLRFTGIARQVTVSYRAGKFYASIVVDTEDYDRKDRYRSPLVGVDLGVRNLATLSDGTTLPANQKLKANLARLQRRSRNLSRKQPGSNRRSRARAALAKLHKRIADQRAATLHEATDMLTRRFDTIVLEDLNVKGMMRGMGRAVSDAGFGTFRRMVEYKAKLRSNTVIFADRFYPSSKTCSRCGTIVADLKRGATTYACGGCGLVTDRDLNAALNLENYGLDTLAPDLKRTQEAGKTGSPAQLLTV